MASTTKSCCACNSAPAQHQRPRWQVSRPQKHTDLRQGCIVDVMARSSICAAAVSGHEAIRAPNLVPDLVALDLNSTALDSTQQTFRQASQDVLSADVVIITKACPYTIASLASAERVSGTGPCCRFPDAVVYMSRDTYNEVCESVAQTQCSAIRERAMQALELISDKIHIFDHSWIIAPGLTVSSVSTPDPSQPPPSFNSMRNTEPLHFMRDPHALVSDDTPIHIVSDSPLTLTKGAFVGCTEDVGDPWFRLNHEVDQRAGSAGRAKLLRTVASGGAMHVFYDAVPDTGVCGNGTESTFQKVHWHAAPAVQRFCPASRR